MRICVYGAGAMGTVLGALLTEGGISCDLVTRNEEHVAALREKGAILCGSAEASVPVCALTPREMSGKYDFIFLATKQRENRKTAEYIMRFLKADGALITVQNGLPEAELAEILGKDRVYGAALSWGAETEGAGRVRITSQGGFRIMLGAYGAGERLSELAGLFGARFSVQTGNLSEIRYAKLAVNAAFSTLSAISGLTFGEISVKYKKYTLAILRETLAVAAAAGCNCLPLNGHNLFKVFNQPFARLILPRAMKQYASTRSGMLKDILAGRRCDVDFVAGVVVQEANRFGVSVPYTARAVELVHEVENGLAELSPETLALLDCR